MVFNDTLFSKSEKTIFMLRELYSKNGYMPFKMSKFEEYDIYAENKNFLISDNVITFTDTNGKLMALKPDVTLSIVKNSKDNINETQRVFYAENVYRVANGSNGFQEIMQTGLECFGKVDDKSIKEVLNLALNSLAIISDNYILAVSNLDIIEDIVSNMQLDSENTKKIYKAISEKNIHEIKSISGENKNTEILCELIGISGSILETYKKVIAVKEKYNLCGAFDCFISFINANKQNKNITIDFSLVGDINYYNGLVFKGYIKGLPDAILSGGQYDKLMQKLSHKSKAIGFAVYTNLIERIEEPKIENDGYINVALPKGRLGEKVYDIFAKSGFECPSILENNRKLIFENSQKKIRYFWVKPSDVAIYVERGSADIGVAGKDILLEYNPDVYELIDLNMGKCRMAVAGKKDYVNDCSKTLRVATKFTNIAKKYYQSLGRDIDIIHLNGSIELAPILGLSDVIVDIVETGTTLKENNLEVLENIVPISARLISNKSSFKFKYKEIENIANSIATIIGETDDKNS